MDKTVAGGPVVIVLAFLLVLALSTLGLLLVVALDWPPPRTRAQNVIPLHRPRHGVIVLRQCLDCGRWLEEHRLTRIAGDWFCNDQGDCLLHQQQGA
jgi:hypothetical protein